MNECDDADMISQVRAVTARDRDTTHGRVTTTRASGSGLAGRSSAPARSRAARAAAGDDDDDASAHLAENQSVAMVTTPRRCRATDRSCPAPAQVRQLSTSPDLRGTVGGGGPRPPTNSIIRLK